MKKLLFLFILTIFSINKSVSQSLPIRVKFTKTLNTVGQDESFMLFTQEGWLLTEDSLTKERDKYPSSLVESYFDNDGNYCSLFSSVEYTKNNPLDDTFRGNIRAFKVVFDKKGGNVLYVLEVGKKYGREINKYYITEFGKSLF